MRPFHFILNSSSQKKMLGSIPLNSFKWVYSFAFAFSVSALKVVSFLGDTCAAHTVFTVAVSHSFLLRDPAFVLCSLTFLSMYWFCFYPALQQLVTPKPRHGDTQSTEQMGSNTTQEYLSEAFPWTYPKISFHWTGSQAPRLNTFLARKKKEVSLIGWDCVCRLRWMDGRVTSTLSSMHMVLRDCSVVLETQQEAWETQKGNCMHIQRDRFCFSSM